ncbi:SusC/RagA family TonB-linked outer membrane protein [Hymenobacter rubidus]|uniref:SusC/RagA family TonB-linked outer membrane protein n=1 Tax=Hymenobacter rubidus TaxID=1441626 RepID=UPI00191F9D9B|nr:TonB-dependent receptor [Hymenobacter rubidus]
MSTPLPFLPGPGPFRKVLLTSALSGTLLTGFGAAQAAAGLRLVPQKTARRDIPVTGRVTNAAGEGLPGVTVLVKGSTTGTSTDVNGGFSLTVPEGSTLVFSSVGFVRQEVVVGTTTTFNIKLADDQQSLKEVVVVGYGTQAKQDLTTAVSSVSGAALTRQPVASFDQALQGQAPGIQVTSSSGAPGAAFSVRVRGSASVSLNGSPLYVIDGIPILPTYNQEINNNNQRLNPLSTIDPNDIERIDVLKDGAAAAIYGLRAANGVVVITTKRGKVGQSQLSLNAYFGRQSLRKKLDVLNARQFAQEYNEIRTNAGQAPGYPDLNNLPPYDTDWQDAIFRSANQQNYQLNASGGTEKTRYYLGGGYFKQDGININSGFDRYNFKINVDQHINDRLRIGTSLNASRSHTNGTVRSESALGNSGTVLGALTQIPTVPVKNPDGVTYGTNPFTLSDNPVGNLLETSNQAVVYQLQNNLYGELDILKDLTLRSTFGIDYRGENGNSFYSRNYPGTSAADPSTRGSASVGNSFQLTWINENTLTYNRTLGDRHHLTLLGGESMQSYDRVTNGGSTKGFPSNSVPYLSAGATANGIPYSFEEQWALLSYFGRAIYNYDERYLATVSFRTDAASRFSGKNRFGYFPAASLGWRISKESFFPIQNVVSDLKLRLSFGANGNSEINTYSRFSTYALGYNYQGSGSAILGGISSSVIGNDVRWETTRQYNAGLDVGLANNRINLTLDVYNKHTSDLLTQVPIPQSTGAGTLSVIQNVGSIENKGVEIGLVTTNVTPETDGFGWTSNFNVTFNRNKVLDLGTTVDANNQPIPRTIVGDNIVQPGSPLGAFYGYRVVGIVQSDAEGQNLPKQNSLSPKAGDIRFEDVDGNGVINASDRVVIGNPNPKAYLGFTNNFTFKGLEMSVFFQSSVGNDIYNQNRTVTEGQTTALNQSTAVLNHWTPTNTNTDIPRPVFGDPNGNNRFSTRFVEDGSYVRLKNLTLAYTIPASISKHAALKNLRIYGTGYNLVTWTKYSGYDPELNADPLSNTSVGRDFGVYPQARTYTVGLNATF